MIILCKLCNQPLKIKEKCIAYQNNICSCQKYGADTDSDNNIIRECIYAGQYVANIVNNRITIKHINEDELEILQETVISEFTIEIAQEYQQKLQTYNIFK